jgi:hypothetical protein
MGCSNTKHRFQEYNTAVLRARITNLPESPEEEGTPITAADIESVRFSVYLDGEVVEGFDNEDLDPEDVLFSSLQGWDQDETGYNFQHYVDPDALLNGGGTMCEVIYKFVTGPGHIYHHRFFGPVLELHAN